MKGMTMRVYRRVIRHIKSRRYSEESGGETIEYLLILALTCGVVALGFHLKSTFKSAGDKANQAISRMTK